MQIDAGKRDAMCNDTHTHTLFYKLLTSSTVRLTGYECVSKCLGGATYIPLSVFIKYIYMFLLESHR